MFNGSYLFSLKALLSGSSVIYAVSNCLLLICWANKWFDMIWSQNCLRTGQHDAAAAAAVAVMSPSVNVLSSSSSQHHTSTISTLSCYSALDTLRLKSQVSCWVTILSDDLGLIAPTTL